MENKTEQKDNLVYFENAKTKKHREYIQLQDHCTLCNTALEVRYLADAGSSTVREEAFCSCCDVRTRNRLHLVN